VSKRKRKRPAPGDRKLPLDGPNWWTGTKAVLHVRVCMGGSNIADSDLRAVIERGDVRAKIEQVRLNYDPPARRSELLKPEFFQREFKLVQHLGAPLALMSRTKEHLLGQWEIYYWGPDVEKIWPTGAAASSDEGTPRQPPGPKPRGNWPIRLAAWVVEIALNEPERLRNVDRLVADASTHPDSKKIGWLPQDPKQVRRVVVEVLQRVR